MTSLKEYEAEKKKREQLLKARNKALALITDVQARYVKEKTRARSKKAAMEKEAVLNSPRYQCLNIYDRKEDIQNDYGYDAITASERDRLEELWDEREEVRSKKDDDGYYKDDVTEMRRLEKERGEEYERLLEKQYNEFVKAK